jgi:hypothetical protein
MAILVLCPGCKKRFNVDDKFAGKTGACPNCKGKITIPEKQPEIKVHAPDEFSGGGKSVTGKLLLKPIARQETRIKPAMAAAIGGAVAGAIVWALVIRFIAPGPGMSLRNVLSGVGLLWISPLLAIAAYTFLRDVDLEPYRGQQLFIRAGVCAIIYIVLWGGLIYVKSLMGSPIAPPMWFMIAPPFLIVGGMAGKFSFDLETSNGFFQYAFYLVATTLLGLIAGLGTPWQ